MFRYGSMFRTQFTTAPVQISMAKPGEAGLSGKEMRSCVVSSPQTEEPVLELASYPVPFGPTVVPVRIIS
jgi:hypothetical protein